MKKQFKLFLYSIGETVLIISIFNAINLVFELIKTNEIICDIAIDRGYLVINQIPIGMHIASNLIALVILSIYVFFNEKLKMKYYSYL